MRGWEIRLGFDQPAVASLRRKNSVFDEICRDYEEMLDQLARNPGAGDAKDLEETIEALARELTGYLQG